MSNIDRVSPLFDKLIPIVVLDNDGTSKVVPLIFRILKGSELTKSTTSAYFFRFEVIEAIIYFYVL